MIKSRLVKLLKAFTKEELINFEKFLESPYHNPSDRVLKFYRHLNQFAPEFTSVRLNSRMIYKALFPGKQFKGAEIVYLTSALTKNAKSFFVYNELKKDENTIEYYLHLAKVYASKNLTDETTRTILTIENLMKPGFSNSKDYLSRYRRLCQLKNIHYKEYQQLDKLIQSKQDYFLVSALLFIWDALEMMSIKGEFSKEVSKSFDLELLLKLALRTGEDRCLTKIYKYSKKDKVQIHAALTNLACYLRKIINEPEVEQNYFDLKKIFFSYLGNPKKKDKSFLDDEEKFDVFGKLVNYCIQRCNPKVNKKFLNEAFAIYYKIVEHEAYYDGKYMSLETFRNITKVCFSLWNKKIETWFINFLEKHTHKLNPKYRDEMYHLSHSYIFFQKKQFEKSYDQIKKFEEDISKMEKMKKGKKIDTNFSLSKTDLRSHELKLMFELNKFDEADKLIHAYENFLYRTKEILPEYKRHFITFVKLCHKLFDLKTSPQPFSKKQIEDLTFDILHQGHVQKPWLLEKIRELENGADKSKST